MPGGPVTGRRPLAGNPTRSTHVRYFVTQLADLLRCCGTRLSLSVFTPYSSRRRSASSLYSALSMSGVREKIQAISRPG
jgi:hypothetical protein